MQIADDNANSSLLINGTELGDGVNEVEPVQYFLYKLGMKPHINSLEIILFDRELLSGLSDFFNFLSWIREPESLILCKDLGLQMDGIATKCSFC